MKGLIFIISLIRLTKKIMLVLLCMLILSNGFTQLRLIGAASASAPTTVTFSSTEDSSWDDGIAEDNEGDSDDVPGITMQFYNISNSSGTLINKPLVHGDSNSNDGFNALTSYEIDMSNNGWTGMGIKSAIGEEFQLNGFFYSNYGEISPIQITVDGYRDGTKVATTLFQADKEMDFYMSKYVTLNDDFDNVDTVLLHSSEPSWHGINNIEIDSAIVPIIDFATTANTSTTAAFSWTAAIGATGVIIQQSPAGQNSWTTASTGAIDTNAISATVTGLSALTDYKFRLVVTGGANAGLSNTANVTTDATPTYLIKLILDQIATALNQGYASGTQETKTIDVTNVGTGNLLNLSATLSGINASDFVISQLAPSLNSGAPAASFTVKAKDGLVAGTYTTTVTVSATNMTDMTFTVTQVVNMPNAPANPQNLSAVRGDRQVSLNWNTVTEATYYNVYMATVTDQFGSTPIATVTDANYNVQNLLNGTSYYFVVKAGNLGGLSAESNQVSATPATVPAAPMNVIAVAGSEQATITFTAPTDNGGSAITGYEVTASPSNIIVTGTSSSITMIGLTNGESYTFTVKAINSVGSSVPSNNTNAVMPRSHSSEGGNSTTAPTPPSTPNTPTTPGPPKTSVDVIVNGKGENVGTATETKMDDQTVTTITIDPKKLEDKLATVEQNVVITIPVNTNSDVVIGQLNGEMIKSLEQKQATIEIKTGSSSYTIPAQQINMNAISERFDKSVELKDIQIQIEIAIPQADTVKIVENSAVKGGFTIVVPPLNFTVRATSGNTTIEVSKFNAYVERIIAIPDGIDPSQITTGIVVDPDGTVRHVPTKIIVIDGKYYAKVSSLTNSTYSIVWHPITFKDVTQHWSKDAVNDMGSRMIISGVGNDFFDPDQDITRAEFAAIIVRGLGLKLESGAAPFSDVNTSDWYNSAIQTAYSYNLISGYSDGTFRPMDKITREQAMTIIAKAMKITGLKAKLPTVEENLLNPFADANQVSEWTKTYIADSLQAAIVSGRSNSQLAPTAHITRAEVAVIVHRLLQKSDLI